MGRGRGSGRGSGSGSGSNSGSGSGSGQGGGRGRGRGTCTMRTSWSSLSELDREIWKREVCTSCIVNSVPRPRVRGLG